MFADFFKYHSKGQMVQFHVPGKHLFLDTKKRKRTGNYKSREELLQSEVSSLGASSAFGKSCMLEEHPCRRVDLKAREVNKANASARADGVSRDAEVQRAYFYTL